MTLKGVVILNAVKDFCRTQSKSFVTVDTV
jgi:hypothetical protein